MHGTHSPSKTATQQSTRTVVAVENLTKRYGNQIAVDDLSFEVPAGQVIGLLGPNGAGKTTAMKMLLGLVKPTSGRASLLGTDVGAADFTHALRRTGALIEAPALYERLSARKNLELQALALGIAVDKKRIDELLELVDLSGRAKDKAGGYSLGMKQRLGIAVGLIGNPEIVVLDEPANGLDPAGIVEIRELLRRLPAMGTTVLVSSHQLAEVQQACDGLVVLAEGRLIAQGTTEEILRSHQTNAFIVRVDPVETSLIGHRLSNLDVNVIDEATGLVSVSLPDGWDGRTLNQALVAEDIFAFELAPEKVSLEEAFLTMTHPTATPALNGAAHVH